MTIWLTAKRANGTGINTLTAELAVKRLLEGRADNGIKSPAKKVDRPNALMVLTDPYAFTAKNASVWVTLNQWSLKFFITLFP